MIYPFFFFLINMNFTSVVMMNTNVFKHRKQERETDRERVSESALLAKYMYTLHFIFSWVTERASEKELSELANYYTPLSPTSSHPTFTASDYELITMNNYFWATVLVHDRNAFISHHQNLLLSIPLTIAVYDDHAHVRLYINKQAKQRNLYISITAWNQIQQT